LIADPADDAGDFFGTEAASNMANTSLATVEKAFNADAAMDAVDQYENLGTIDPAEGNDVDFFVDGNATFGGANSDALAYLGTGSTFEVTGDASFADGGSSTADLVFLDADFTIGNDLSVARGSFSSATAFFAENTVSIGNDWRFGGHLGGSTATLGIFDSTVIVGGNFDALLGGGTAEEITFDMVDFSTGGDFLAGAEGGSAVSAEISNSTLSGGGDFRLMIREDSSVQSLDVLNATFDFGGDIFIGADPATAVGQSTMVVSTDDVSFTGDHFTISLPGEISSLASSHDETVFDLDGNFLIDGPGDDSDSTHLFTNTSGTVDGDFVIVGAKGVNSDTTVVIGDFDPDIGGDLRFDMPALGGSTSTLAMSNFTPNVTGDAFFDLDGGAGAMSAVEITIGDSTISNLAEFTARNGAGSTIEIEISDSMLSGGGAFLAETGANSVHDFETADTTFDFGGDFSAGIVGNGSAFTAQLADNDILAANAGFVLDGDDGSSSVSLERVDFTLGGNFRIDGPGSDSDQLVFMEETTGSVGGDFVIGAAGGSMSTYDTVLLDFSPTIGGDFRLSTPATATSSATAFLAEFASTVTGDLEISLPAGPGSTSTLTLTDFTPDVTGDVLFDVARDPGATGTDFDADVDFIAGGDVTITQNTFASFQGTAGVGGTFFHFGHLAPTAGENFIVDGPIPLPFMPMASDELFVGPTGTATLLVGQGGTLTADLLTLGALATGNGTLNLSGSPGSRGAVIVPDLVEGLGMGSVEFDGGIYRTTANNADLFGTFEPGDVLFDGGGAFIDTNGFDMTSAYPFAGPGGLTKLGMGVLTLNGAGNWMGGTTVEAGMLVAGTMTSFPQNTPYEVNGGTLDLNDFDLTASQFGGAGGVVDLGTASLTVDQMADTAFAGEITGTGGLTKTGEGTLALDGTNTYTGDTAIDEGALLVNGSVASPNTFVNPGGLLGGVGVVGGNVINDGGIVSPGLSPGVLRILGDYAQGSTGALAIEIASRTNFDRLVIDGTASLDGTLRVSVLGDYLPGMDDEFTVLTAAGGRSGTFSTFDQSGSPVVFGIRYGSDDATLFVEESRFAPFFGPALTPNQRAVAAALDATSSESRQAGLVEFLLSELSGRLPANLDRIAPEELAAMSEILLATSESQGRTVSRRLENARAGLAGTSSFSFRDSAGPLRIDDAMPMLSREVFASKQVGAPSAKGPAGRPLGRNAWVAGAGEFVDLDGDGNGSGFDFDSGAFTVGYDREPVDGLILGIAGGYVASDADLVAGGELEVDGLRGMAYGSWSSGGAFVDAIAGVGYHEFDASRSALAGFASGDTEGVSVDALVEGGFDIPAGAFEFGPLLSLGYAGADIHGYRERGSLAPLGIEPGYEDSLRSRIGLRLGGEFDTAGVKVSGEFRAQWQHEYLDDNRSVGARFANGAGGPFTVFGPSLGRDSVVIGAGLTAEFSPTVSGYLGYEAEFGRDRFDRHTLQIGASIAY